MLFIKLGQGRFFKRKKNNFCKKYFAYLAKSFNVDLCYIQKKNIFHAFKYLIQSIFMQYAIGRNSNTVLVATGLKSGRNSLASVRTFFGFGRNRAVADLIHFQDYIIFYFPDNSLSCIPDRSIDFTFHFATLFQRCSVWLFYLRTFLAPL